MLILIILKVFIKLPNQPGWWHRHISPTFLMQSQEAHEFQTRLGYTANTVREREMERGEGQIDREEWGRKSFF